MLSRVFIEVDLRCVGLGDVLIQGEEHAATGLHRLIEPGDDLDKAWVAAEIGVAV
jgi:hypothetical protein